MNREFGSSLLRITNGCLSSPLPIVTILFINGLMSLKAKGHHIIGYGIMPNHLHLLAALNYDNKERLNTLIGNAKRFMAYGIINRLEKMGKQDMLNRLTDGVQRTDKIKGQLHRVFEPSFDAKRCDSFFMYSGGLLTRDPPRTESIVKLINKPPTNLAEPS